MERHGQRGGEFGKVSTLGGEDEAVDGVESDFAWPARRLAEDCEHVRWENCGRVVDDYGDLLRKLIFARVNLDTHERLHEPRILVSNYSR